MTWLAVFLLSGVAIALVESAVDKFGYDWEALPRTRYAEVLHKLKVALQKDSVGRRISPVTVLFGTETVKKPELASILFGKLYGLVIIDSKQIMYVVFISELKPVGVKVTYGPIKFTPESPKDFREMKTVQGLVRARNFDGARKETFKWYKETKRNGLFGGTSINIH